MFVSQAAVREWNARKEDPLIWRFSPHDLLAFHALSKPLNSAAASAVTSPKKNDNGNGNESGKDGKNKGWLNFTDTWDVGRFWPGGNN